MNGSCPICRLCDSYSLWDNGDKVCLACGCNYKERHTAEDFFTEADWKAIKDAWTNREELGEGYYARGKKLKDARHTRWAVKIQHNQMSLYWEVDEDDLYGGGISDPERFIRNDDYNGIHDYIYRNAKLPLPAFEQLDIFGGTA